ncbi:MAG: hypothetical protein A2Y17_10655 [Clostridiales bacterium GWF2_38_85]|nr:MAG: hypothetical protein A2Y17_10655 [Clostridiales bacterium GWF2_38_85]HBL83489.1 hypothetical protein [Clostridiales bacterium]
MQDNIIAEIKQIEEQAELNAKDAVQKAAEIVNEARIAMQKTSKTAYDNAIKKVGEILTEAEKQAAELTQKIVSSGKIETDKLCEKSKQNANNAIDFILKDIII